MRKLALFCLILTGVVVTLNAQDTNSVLQVVGKASLKAKPENMVLSIPISVKDSLFENCSTELMDKMQALVEDLSHTGIDKEDIKSDDLSLVEDYEYIGRERKKVGYVGRVSVHVEKLYTPELIGKIINVLGVHSLDYSLQFRLSEQQKTELTEQAIKEAIADAKQKAQVIAEESGVELKNISKISYDYRSQVAEPLLKTVMNETSLATGGGQPEFNPREVSIEKQVQIEWRIN